MTCKLSLGIIILIISNFDWSYGAMSGTRDQVNVWTYGCDVSGLNLIDCSGKFQSTIIKSSYIKTSSCYIC